MCQDKIKIIFKRGFVIEVLKDMDLDKPALLDKVVILSNVLLGLLKS